MLIVGVCLDTVEYSYSCKVEFMFDVLGNVMEKIPIVDLNIPSNVGEKSVIEPDVAILVYSVYSKEEEVDRSELSDIDAQALE